MTTLTQDIKDKLTRLNVLEKIIVINLVVFIVGLIYKPFIGWLELPSSLNNFILKPWAIITYAFAHYDVIHILFNMLWLYIIGQWFLNLFNPKLALNVYFLGAIAGGLFYMLIYNLFPGVFGNSNMVGASASVRALLIFLCAYMPNREIRFFTIGLKFWYFGLAIVIIDFIGVFGLNAGGNLAHLGGALLGYVYAKQFFKGKDIGKGFGNILESFLGLFKFSKKSSLKTVHKNKNKVAGYTKDDFKEFNNQKKIDVILDKISKSGYDSLTAEEKEFLFRAGK